MADQTDEECCDDPQCGSCDTCREHCQCWHDDVPTGDAFIERFARSELVIR